MQFDKISVYSVRDTFVQTIEDKILSEELKIGDKLPPAKELCRQMGVSLTVVNAGMAELASKGFVEIKPRHGTYVADYRANGTPETLLSIMRYRGGKLNKHEVRSFCETRIALDPFVAQLVIERADDEQIKELFPMLESIRSERDTDKFCTLVLDFFKKIYMLSDNTIFTLLYNSTVQPQKGMYKIFIEKNGFDIIISCAEKVYESLLARDTASVKKCLVDTLMLPVSGTTSIVSD